jgi:Fungal specific transcription factor domain
MPLDQYALDSYNSEWLHQFSDVINTTSVNLHEHDSLESPFPFMELSEETQLFDQGRKSGSVDQVGFQEHNPDELWPRALLNTEQSNFGIPKLLASPIQSSAPLSIMPLSQALQDHSSILVEYYFKEVCGMMSCYDSQMNPYRTTVSNAWSHSESLYYITQSMAAACLSDVSSNLSLVGRQLRDEATRCLLREVRGKQINTSSLLALVMLGMSLSWHDPASLGQSEFDLLAEAILSLGTHENNLPLADTRQKLFFYNSIVYWRMLLSFVTDRDLCSPTTRYIQPQAFKLTPVDPREPRIPHPQTGIGIEVQELVAQVGSLVRKERKRILSRRSTSREDIEQAETSIQAAEQLHLKLCAVDLPRETEVIDPGDDNTPTTHLLQIAEAYRCTGLLQLYRNFSDLLPLYTPSEHSTNQSVASEAAGNIYTCTDTSSSADTWLTCLALHILDLIQGIPVSSRSRSIQPLLLVSICSELSLSRSSYSISSLQPTGVASIASSPRFKVPPTISDILHARRSITARLSSFENILAAKPVRQMLILVKTTWEWMDERQQDVYWMDVLMEKGCETLMG